jgi:thioesterase domain-containing protein
VNPAPASAMVDVLTPIWQRVLQRSPISAEDNFFDLGGDLALAVKLFVGIAEECGQELPVETICRAPTIAALASFLEQFTDRRAHDQNQDQDRSTPPSASPLVLLSAGAGQAPLFIAHGLDGGVIKFFQLARHIPSWGSVYGIQAKGFDRQPPLDRIEDMVPSYLDAIRKKQPHGPYFLIGYSFGGLIMLEIAQRLLTAGEQVALLVMVDSYPHFHKLPRAERARVIARRIRAHLSHILQSPPRDAVSYIIRRWESRSRTPNAQIDTILGQFVKDQNTLALIRYEPQFYPGKIKFVQSETESYYPADPPAVWGHLAADFEYETTPGDHQSLLTTHFDELGALLTRYLREATVHGETK